MEGSPICISQDPVRYQGEAKVIGSVSLDDEETGGHVTYVLESILAGLARIYSAPFARVIITAVA